MHLFGTGMCFDLQEIKMAEVRRALAEAIIFFLQLELKRLEMGCERFQRHLGYVIKGLDCTYCRESDLNNPRSILDLENIIKHDFKNKQKNVVSTYLFCT